MRENDSYVWGFCCHSLHKCANTSAQALHAAISTYLDRRLEGLLEPEEERDREREEDPERDEEECEREEERERDLESFTGDFFVGDLVSLQQKKIKFTLHNQKKVGYIRHGGAGRARW